MKNVYDYVFSQSWQTQELQLQQGVQYPIFTELGPFKPGEMAIFLGFEDIDNHYGKFVFKKHDGEIVEFPGDYSGPTHTSFLQIKCALRKI
ncbi:MAG TPA: hypothetical protein PKE57_06645 [Cellvibrionaceae bacterium]|nr:hypothetical protein [Cellvibrionaceae bacterium]HMW47765.1 hypothetical protein [Cellvibrionaceae bacterium]HMW70167.1 hypothetical protein [Cellvibrionaceae bacterium]HNG59328.1 hypothetical protein [Cellvibrionaceae bacterium]